MGCERREQLLSETLSALRERERQTGREENEKKNKGEEGKPKGSLTLPVDPSKGETKAVT